MNVWQLARDKVKDEFYITLLIIFKSLPLDITLVEI